MAVVLDADDRPLAPRSAPAAAASGAKRAIASVLEVSERRPSSASAAI